MTSPLDSGAHLPDWTVIRDDDYRHRLGAVEAPPYVSAEGARSIRAASNRPWANAAKVIAALAAQRPDARYVEGWASRFAPMWHAWVDVPLDTSEKSWLRIDPTPNWRWTLEHNRYSPVLEVRGATLAPFVQPLLQPRGRALCRLPLAPLAPAPKLASYQPMPADSFATEFGAEAAARASELHGALVKWHTERATIGHADVRAELDRFAAMRVLPGDG